MNVAGLNDFQFYFFMLGTQCPRQKEHTHKNTCTNLHNIKFLKFTNIEVFFVLLGTLPEGVKKELRS